VRPARHSGCLGAPCARPIPVAGRCTGPCAPRGPRVRAPGGHHGTGASGEPVAASRRPPPSLRGVVVSGAVLLSCGCRCCGPAAPRGARDPRVCRGVTRCTTITAMRELALGVGPGHYPPQLPTQYRRTWYYSAGQGPGGAAVAGAWRHSSWTWLGPPQVQSCYPATGTQRGGGVPTGDAAPRPLSRVPDLGWDRRPGWGDGGATVCFLHHLGQVRQGGRLQEKGRRCSGGGGGWRGRAWGCGSPAPEGPAGATP
jgi:hypothetical protein